MKDALRPRTPTAGPGLSGVLLALLVACGDGNRGSEELATLSLGRSVFTELAEPTCASCHSLQDAGASGPIGPDLNGMKPDIERVMLAVTHGVGVMPAQKDRLTEAQIRAVAYYVARVAGEGD